MHIALLHTAQIHADTFDGLFSQMDLPISLTHHVAPDLLDTARKQGLDAVRGDIMAALTTLASADAVICTCSTIGPVAGEFAATAPHVLRIDQPMMQAACRAGPNILVAICLDSTRAPTLALLHDTAKAMGADITPEVLFCGEAWPLFEAARFDEFAQAVAAQIRACVTQGGVDCVVLAQASMRGAGAHLGDLGVPVLSSPQLAAERAVEIASRNAS